MSDEDDARQRARQRFVSAIQARPVRLDEAAAWLAAEEHPQTDGDDLLALLDVLTEGLWIPPDAPLTEQIARLNQHVFIQLKFSGDREHYLDPRYSCLDTVLQERRGLPILLCVVYMEIARRAGIDIDGIGFPGHFLVSPAASDPKFYIDPFNEGRVVRTQQLYERLQRMSDGKVVANPGRYLATVPNHYLLVRICNNLKGAHLRTQDVEGAIRAVERLVLLEPNHRDEWRELGLMRNHVGRHAAAAEAFQTYIERWPDAPDLERIRGLLDEITEGLR